MDTFRQPRPMLCLLALVTSRKPPGNVVVRIVFPLLLASLATGFPTARAIAQESGTLTGRVSTADRTPLSQARVSVIGTTLVTVADTDGTFRIGTLPVGPQTVQVKLLGYATIELPVKVEAGRDAFLQVTLTAIPVPLATVKVTADTMILPEMRGFLARRGRGSGKFLTRDDIDQMEARHFTDVLRRVPGMHMEPREGPFGPSYAVQSTRTEGMNGGRGCPVLFYLNGVPFPVTSDLEINRYVSPADVAAVEIYTGASQIPPQFNSTTLNANCGVIVIWTRIRSSAIRSR